MKQPNLHQKRILVVEDQEQFYAPIRRWLESEDYEVTVVTNYEDAVTAVNDMHFHLAIVDLNLDDNAPEKEEGLDLLRQIDEKKLNKVMPCIVLTAHGNMRNILVATQELHVAKFIPKEANFRRKLLDAIEELFLETVGINFELVYDTRSSQIVKEVADDVNWSMTIKPDVSLLTAQVRDLFGKLFADARRIHVRKLKPGLTGSAVIRVQPTWDHGLGPPYVAKVGREDKVRTEAERYETYVRRYLPPNTIAQVKDVSYTRHVGVLLYTFTENDMVPLKEFDEFYKARDPDVINDSLRNLFETTCRYWYDARDQKQYAELPQLYYKAFNLTPEKLVRRIQVVLPDFDAHSPTFFFEGMTVQAINPVWWLNEYAHELELPIYHCITHGDLTGRNIMVDQNDKCWLIDFYRTYDSHIMRDFVILETDIKYRLLDEPDANSFLMMEKALLAMDDSGQASTLSMKFPRTVLKAYAVINALRATAYKFASSGIQSQYQASRKEHLISLLMTTLNVARLRHIKEERKLQAMLSASLICAELDRLAGRSAQYPKIESERELETLTLEPRPFNTAQQRFLTNVLKQDKLSLFIGSDTPTGFVWPASLGQLVALTWHAIYTTNRHTMLEEAYELAKRPFHLVESLPDPQASESLPLFKLFGTQGDNRNEKLPRSRHILRQLRRSLEDGRYLLLICATEQELLTVQEACHNQSEMGLLWMTGADLPEEMQDDYRNMGFRVLPDTPDDILAVLGMG